MADDEAEKAFFEAQARDADTANYEATEKKLETPNGDDYDPLQSGHTLSTTSLPNPNSSAVASSLSNSLHENSLPGDLSQVQDAGVTLPGDDGSNISIAPLQSTSLAIHGQNTVEGTGEEDGGEAEYEPPAVLSHVQDMASLSADIPQGSVSQNMNETVSPFDVSQQQTVSDKITPHDVSNNSSVPASSNVGISAQSESASKTAHNGLQPPTPLPSVEPTKSPTPAIPTASATSRARLPHDRVGILEDRIAADPRGDMEAWLELISEHRSRNKIEGARQVYERFFKVFPSAAEQWVAYANMESENNELYRLEQIFSKTLLSIPNVQLWSVYLDYVRRRNNLTTDTTGQARRTISAAYDFALQNIGIDKDSGSVWQDYIQFIQSGPGNIGGSGWQDQQKMDSLRKAYQRAICVPTGAINSIWKDYDQFEMGLNKLTGRKFLQEKSPLYMTARSSYTELQNITRDLVRTTLPRLPPAPGFEGDAEYRKQTEIWKRWIKWEKDDPLVLKDEDPAAYKARVVYVYKQALMALRFLPEIWFEAADFCFQNGMETEGNEFLKQGIDANPESCLLAFKRGDQLEIATASEQDSKKRGARVREPYDRLLDALYELINKAKAKEAEEISQVEQKYAQAEAVAEPSSRPGEDEEEEGGGDESKTREAAKASEIEAVKRSYAGQIGALSKTISYAWIALMRAMRRIQGKGKPGEIPGSRQIFADARKRGRITSDVYIASALMEYHCYKDPAATKIFERGAKLFPEDEVFALEYLKHLIDINDITNARAVFETTVRRLASNPKNVAKAKPIFAFLHEYESRYGDLVQIINLENRMRELFPEDPTLKHFAHRYSAPAFDPTAFQPVISPSQVKPKPAVAVEEAPSQQNSPAPRYMSPATHSPKRAFPTEEFDDDYHRPRKFIRAESPLKGAAGRRLDQQKRIQQQSNGSGGPGGQRGLPPPPPLPKEIMFLLGIIPPASTYDSVQFNPEKMVNLLRHLEIPQSVGQLRQHQTPGSRPQYAGGWNYT
ncbi:hypothetical protein VTO42DRAFT_3551 [Malbranchea cinnamomea]